MMGGGGRSKLRALFGGANQVPTTEPMIAASDVTPDAPQLAVAGKRNVVKCEPAPHAKGVVITITGDDNVVTVNPETQIDGLRIMITGNSNRVTIDSAYLLEPGIVLGGDGNTVSLGARSIVRGTGIVCEDGGNEISVGADCELHIPTELSALEGTRLLLGERCLLSGGGHYRTGDSHSVTDLEGRRINPSADIVIGDHVWVGRNVTVLKGVRIAESCVVGACAVVTRTFDRPHCAIAGNPAGIIREDVDWCVERIPVD
jgi:acetyltransferase-like isoleucine patch superfamily enzyme